MSPGSALALAGLAVGGCLRATMASAVAPPDPEQLPRLQAACDPAWRVRVTATSGFFHSRGVIVDAGGITIPRPPGRPAMITVGDPRPPERVLRWSEIETVGVEQPKALRGALTGLVVGAALGSAMMVVFGTRSHDAYPAVLWSARIVALGCTALGAVIGAGSPEVHPLYP